jgi:hypothetical protein
MLGCAEQGCDRQGRGLRRDGLLQFLLRLYIQVIVRVLRIPRVFLKCHNWPVVGLDRADAFFCTYNRCTFYLTQKTHFLFNVSL